MNLSQKQLDSEWSALRAFEKATLTSNTNHWMRFGRTPLEGKQKLEFIAHYKFQLFLKYNPNQPRHPSGQSNGGQFAETADGTGFSSQEDTVTGASSIMDDYRNMRGSGNVDLKKEQGGTHGGHAYSKHIGKSKASLVQDLRKETIIIFGREYGSKGLGSFDNEATANFLVNRVLKSQPELVELVSNGDIKQATIFSTFDKVTGYEAFRENGDTPIETRDTYGVFVKIAYTKNMAKGFGVVTAYPATETQNATVRNNLFFPF